MRRSLTLLTTLTLSFALAGPPPAPATSHWCSDPGATAPCIMSATLNGAPVTSSDPTWDVSVIPSSAGGSSDLFWSVQKDGSGATLGGDALDDVWVITIETGGVIPRLAFTHGKGVSVVRSGSQVTITATPIVITGECDQSVWPWTCPVTATQEWNGYLDGQITDYAAWTPASQRASFFGMNYHSNVAATSVPPEIENDPSGAERLLIRLANPHFRMDGVTVFEGFAHLRIPNLFLRRVYGIDDPSTLTGAGLSPSGVGSASVSVTQEAGGDAVLVDIEGLTFSTRLVRLSRGKITPTKPKKVRAKRVAPERGKLRFKDARARGSKVKRYRAKCVGGFSVVKARGKDAPLRAKLVPGDSYRCRVRAKSKAGFGPWSRRVKL